MWRIGGTEDWRNGGADQRGMRSSGDAEDWRSGDPQSRNDGAALRNGGRCRLSEDACGCSGKRERQAMGQPEDR